MTPEVKEINGKLYPWMKVETYYIRSYSRLIESEGFIDHDTNTAYEEDQCLIMSEEKWKATDIETGLLIAKDKSFEDLYKKVESMKETIANQKATRDYEQWKRQYNMILNGELGKLVNFVE